MYGRTRVRLTLSATKCKLTSLSIDVDTCCRDGRSLVGLGKGSAARGKGSAARGSLVHPDIPPPRRKGKQ